MRIERGKIRQIQRRDVREEDKKSESISLAYVIGLVRTFRDEALTMEKVYPKMLQACRCGAL